MKFLLREILLALTLIWRPWRLVSVVRQAGEGVAAGIGFCAATAFLVAATLPLLAGMDEPYLTYGAYLANIPNCFHWEVLLGPVLLFAAVAVCIRAAALVGLLVVDSEGDSNTPQVTLVLLSPICFTIPVLLWIPLSCFGAPVWRPSLTIVAGVPAWVSSSPIAIFGSPWMLLVMIVCDVILVFRTDRAMRRACAQPGGACAHCGYALAGLATTRCPECGLMNDPPRA